MLNRALSITWCACFAKVDADFARALPILSTPGVQQSPLGSYAEYYKGLAELRLGRTNDAKRTFQALASKEPTGYLAEAAPLREAESDEALGDHAAALDIYERLAKTKLTAPDDVLMRLARAAKAVGNKDQAADAYARVMYEFPFSDLAIAASAELENLPIAPVVPGSNRYRLELGRAERLFGAKRYPQARAAFDEEKSYLKGAYGEAKKSSSSLVLYDDRLPNVMAVLSADPKSDQGRKGIGMLVVRYYDPVTVKEGL